MTSKEALKSICLKCEKAKGVNKVACPFRSISNDYCEEFEIIEKELKALEIIKNKRVDLFELLLGISNSVYRNPLERYNSYVEGSFNTELTQEEFNVLEDVLGK